MRKGSNRSSFGHTAPGRTARSKGSTAPCSPSGHTARSSSPTTSAQPPLHPGSSTTTLNVATAHSEDSHPSPGCYQPDGRVQLARLLNQRAAPPQPTSSASSTNEQRLLNQRAAPQREAP